MSFAYLFRDMLTKLIKILFFTLLFYFGVCQVVFSQEPLYSEEEDTLLELINEARKEPLAMAESLGVDRDTVLRDLPGLNAVLKKGLAPLRFSDSLYRAATGHTEDMIAKTYYSHNSPDGRTYSERIRESGYLAAVCGESLGLVAFRNFMDTAEAVRIIFESIFLGELDPETTEERNILNPALTEVGIAFGSGQFTAGGVILNAYPVTFDFGKPVAGAEAVEQTLISMINSARKNPGQALLSAGIDPETAAEAYGDLAWALTGPLAPLARDQKLHGTATAHNRDMRDRLYFGTVSPDGTTPFERVESAGYAPDNVGESLGMTLGVLEVSKVDGPFDVARCLYEILLKNDVDPRSDVQRNIFDPFLTEVGIGLAIYLDPDPEGGEDGSLYYTVVADFARPLDLKPFVMGTFYEDRNKNGVIDEGEGISGSKITLSPDDEGMGQEKIVTESSPTGRYQMTLSTVLTGFMKLHVQREKDVFGPFYIFVEETKENMLRNIGIRPK